MNEFFSQDTVPLWRFVLYGVLTAVAVVIISIFTDIRLLLAAPVAGFAVFWFGYCVQRTSSKVWLRTCVSSHPRLSLAIGLLAAALFIIWSILDRH